MKVGDYLPSQENELTQEDISFAVEYVRGLMSNSSPHFYNPIMSNQYLKNLNMNPAFQDRDTVEKMVCNPKDNEQGLRRLSQHLYNTQTPYKRLIKAFPDMLTFDVSVYPMGCSEEDIKSNQFKKDYDQVFKWLEKFDYKKEFRKILVGMMLEDGKYTYLRNSENGMTLQEMPSDWCLIDAWSELGWLYSFNLLYFNQTGVDINGFPPEFKKHYNNMLEMKNNGKYFPNIRSEMRNGRWCYWQQINPQNGWVFKLDDTFAGLIPPLVGLFIDAIEIDTYKKIQKNKTALENYKMIFGTIPRNKDNKTGNKSDDFSINASTLAEFIKLIKTGLPEGVDFKAAPLDNITPIEFNKADDKNNIVGTAMKNFYENSGVERAMFSSDRPNASTMKASTLNDISFIEGVYPQFEQFLKYHINKTTKKYKFEIKLSGNIFQAQEKFDNEMTKLSNGIITPDLPAALHLTEKELRTGMALMASLGYPENFKPVQTSFTQSKDGKKDSGRPEQKEIKESGETTRDAGSNEK